MTEQYGYAGKILIVSLTGHCLRDHRHRSVHGVGGRTRNGLEAVLGLLRGQDRGGGRSGKRAGVRRHAVLGRRGAGRLGALRVHGHQPVLAARMVQPLQHGRPFGRHDEGSGLRRLRGARESGSARVDQRGERPSDVQRRDRPLGTRHLRVPGEDLGRGDARHRPRLVVRADEGARRRPHHAATVRHLHRTCRREPGTRVVHRARCRPRDGTERLRRGVRRQEPQGDELHRLEEHTHRRPRRAREAAVGSAGEVRLRHRRRQVRGAGQPERRIHRAGHEPHGVARRRMPRLLQELP